MDQLGHKYISYTHGTVVEFTQDEGDVGLPAPIAQALLDPQRRLAEHAEFTIPVKRTQDPSGMDTTSDAETAKLDTDEHTSNGEKDEDIDDETKTPGHVAYGAFDVPTLPVEITMVRLPKGKGCTLIPTHEAIRNGFYNLQDVKLVLEQSLIRTRATLSVGDTVHTWHRGIKYDLHVSKVLPSTYHAVTCINTDIEVELGEVKDCPPDTNTNVADQSDSTTRQTASSGHTLSGGRVLSSLSSSAPADAPQSQASATAGAASTVELIPEPSPEQKEGICTVQLRGDGIAPARRRFDVQAATLEDIFAFAQTVLEQSNNNNHDPTTFRLVTRFPRTVFELNEGNRSSTMAEAGIQSGQELLMIERI